jgi:hypothetical protein
MAEPERMRWTKLVADFESCDLTQLECATERGISINHLRYRIYRRRKESRIGRINAITETSPRADIIGG